MCWTVDYKYRALKGHLCDVKILPGDWECYYIGLTVDFSISKRTTSTQANQQTIEQSCLIANYQTISRSKEKLKIQQ